SSVFPCVCSSRFRGAAAPSRRRELLNGTIEQRQLFLYTIIRTKFRQFLSTLALVLAEICLQARHRPEISEEISIYKTPSILYTIGNTALPDRISGAVSTL